MQAKKILFISSWYPDRITHANGDFVKRHARTAALHNKVVTFFVKYDPELRHSKEIIEQSEGNFTEIILYFGLSGILNNSLTKFIHYVKYYRWGSRYIRKRFFMPDLIHANITFPIGMVAYYYHKFFRCPYVISEHWSAYLPVNNHLLPFWRKMIDRFVVQHAEMMLPVTENMGEALKGLGFNNKYVVLPNVVDIEGFSPAKSAFPEKKFIHLSTLNDKTKNISGMIEAVKILSEKRDDFHLELIGLESIEQHISYAKELGVYEKYVSVHSRITHDKVAERLRNSMGLLMFSNFESLPCVIIEALASGLPVISSDVGGIKEYLTDKEGILVPKGDIEKLVEAMDYMLDHYHQYDRKHLREHAVNNFSPAAIADRMDAIYHSIPSHA